MQTDKQVANLNNHRGHRNAMLVLFMLPLCFVLQTGCGGGVEKEVTGTASGKVTMAGVAVTGGLINFTSATTGAGAYGELQADGSYELNGPVPIGDYKIYLSPPEFGDSPTKEQLAGALKGVPEKYKSELTTNLTASVVEGSNTFDFDLK